MCEVEVRYLRFPRPHRDPCGGNLCFSVLMHIGDEPIQKKVFAVASNPNATLEASHQLVSVSGFRCVVYRSTKCTSPFQGGGEC